MCGRDSAKYTWKEIHAFSQPLVLTTPVEDPVPNYNRAPTQEGWVIAADGEEAVAKPMRWGLLPFWAKNPRVAYSTFNARLETVATKPAFRDAWKSRRALIPSSGYFEWKTQDKLKQPYLIRPKDAPVWFYAGLWERGKGDDGEDLLTYSIVTTDVLPVVGELHDRMPLILPAEVLTDWLHGSPDDAMAIALSVPEPPIVFHPVDRAVGNVRNKEPQLLEPIDNPIL